MRNLTLLLRRHAVAVVALFLVLAAPATAALIVTGAEVQDDSLTGADIVEGTLARVPASSHASRADVVAGFTHLPRKRVTPYVGATAQADARAKAPEHVLLARKPVTIYAKCYLVKAFATTAPYDGIYAEVFARSDVAGATLLGDDRRSGTGVSADATWLNPTTPEVDRQILGNLLVETGTANARDREFTLLDPYGTSLQGRVYAGALMGKQAFGHGVYGTSDACVFGGHVTG